tara:strand:+ start:3400 stop:3918 length:519 start_codon:yes stop_codon:yes gene_type:complete
MVDYHNNEIDEDTMNLNYSELSEQIQSLLDKVRQKTNGQTIRELESLEDYYERHTQIRSMHIQTLTCEVEELKAKNIVLLKRVENVRNKCLIRKFQSRFWMTMASILMFNSFAPTIKHSVVNNVFNCIIEVIYGNSIVARIYRGSLLIFMNYQIFIALNSGKYFSKIRHLIC